MKVVVADIHGCAGLRRDHVRRGVARVDCDESQRRWIKVVGATVQLMRRHTVNQPPQRRNRVIRAMRIGRVTLNTHHSEPCRQRSAAPDLHHFAHFIRTGRLTNQTDRHGFTLLIHPIQKSDRAIIGITLFVTCDGDRNRAIGWSLLNKINGGRDECRNARLHIRRAATIHEPVFDLCAKRINGPVVPITQWYDIRMTIEPERAVRPFTAPSRV